MLFRSLLTGNAGKILEFIADDDYAGRLFARPEKSALVIYIQAYKACLDLKDNEGAEKYKNLAERFSD